MPAESKEKALFKQFKGSTEAYLNELKSCGLVSGLIVGEKKRERRAFFWQIWEKEITLSESGHEPYTSHFNRVSEVFEIPVRKVVPLRMSSVNPSGVESVLRACEKKGINTEVINFKEK